MSLDVDPESLRAAGCVWQQQGEQQGGASANLDDVEPAAVGVGERAAPALEVFAGHWAERVRGLQATSSDLGDGLGGRLGDRLGVPGL